MPSSRTLATVAWSSGLIPPKANLARFNRRVVAVAGYELTFRKRRKLKTTSAPNAVSPCSNKNCLGGKKWGC
jgi:hypothetical protein